MRNANDYSDTRYHLSEHIDDATDDLTERDPFTPREKARRRCEYDCCVEWLEAGRTNSVLLWMLENEKLPELFKI